MYKADRWLEPTLDEDMQGRAFDQCRMKVLETERTGANEYLEKRSTMLTI